MCYTKHMSLTTAIILAAGLGTRMKSALPKALHIVSGQPMIQHVVDAARPSVDEIVCVVGYAKEKIMDMLGDTCSYVEQREQKGTGHAAMMATEKFGDTVLMLFSDTPLITPETVSALLELHKKSGAAASLVSADFEQPGALGRIVRDENGEFLKVVEYKVATEEERRIKEVNSGIAVFDGAILKEKLALLTCDNPQGEYLLTDVYDMVRADGKKVAILKIDDPNEIIGVNDRFALAEAEKMHQDAIKKRWMLAGVTMNMPETIYIEKNVKIAQDVTLLQGTRLLGDTVVESGAVIGPYSEIRNSEIRNGAKVEQSVVVDSVVGVNATVGPYTYLRPHTALSEKAKVGSFVEIKNSTIGKGSKVPHLSYIGDGDVGEGSNIGCGVIFANYDGKSKHRTVVGDRTFIGSNVNLVAPVRIGNDAFVAAGSTITKDVGDREFAKSRAGQDTRPNRNCQCEKDE